MATPIGPAARPLTPARSAVTPAPQPAAPKPVAATTVKATGGQDGPVASVGGVFGKLQGALRWLLMGPTVKEFKTFETLRSPSVSYASGDELKAAKAHLAASQQAEAAALAKLGPRADEYRQVADLCSHSLISRDVLLKMLLDGRLTGQKDLAGKGDMLGYLSKMATQELPGGMDRTELLTDIIQEMDDPTKLNQQNKGTCAATTATVVLTRQAPAEYARLVQELASPAGQTKTIKGNVLKRNPDWADNNDGGRTPSMRMLEPALMQLGNPVFKYDNNRDAYTLASAGFMDTLKRGWDSFKSTLASLKDKFALPGGLETAGMHRVLESLTGKDYSMIYTVTRLNRPFAWHRVEEAVAAGKSVPVGMVWEDGGHEILVDKIQDGFVYFNNPWGESDRMSVDEFKANLQGANLPK